MMYSLLFRNKWIAVLWVLGVCLSIGFSFSGGGVSPALAGANLLGQQGGAQFGGSSADPDRASTRRPRTEKYRSESASQSRTMMITTAQATIAKVQTEVVNVSSIETARSMIASFCQR